MKQPWEDSLAISHQLKKAKYQDLMDEALAKGWYAALYPIEVGCRSFQATSEDWFGTQTTQESHSGDSNGSRDYIKMVMADKRPQLEPWSR